MAEILLRCIAIIFYPPQYRLEEIVLLSLIHAWQYYSSYPKWLYIKLIKRMCLNMKKPYEKPEIEITIFEIESICDTYSATLIEAG